MRLDKIEFLILWFKKPYPYPQRWYERVGVSVIVALLVFLVLFVFKPFGINKIDEGSTLVILDYSIITVLVMLSTSFTMPLFFRKFFNPDNWTIGKYLTHVLGDFFSISLFSWIFTLVAARAYIEADTFLKFLGMTFSVSFFPVILIVHFYERIQFKQKLENAKMLSENVEVYQESGNTSIPSMLELSDNGKTFLVRSNDFICAKAIGNYTTVYFKESNEIKHVLIRLPISKLEKMLLTDESIIRCHRSTIVNLIHVSRFSGNARNYIIHIKNANFQFNLSRSISKELLEKLMNYR
jgi:DNA-binding LytR/AlgR family response regulator